MAGQSPAPTPATAMLSAPAHPRAALATPPSFLAGLELRRGAGLREARRRRRRRAGCREASCSASGGSAAAASGSKALAALLLAVAAAKEDLSSASARPARRLRFAGAVATGAAICSPPTDMAAAAALGLSGALRFRPACPAAATGVAGASVTPKEVGGGRGCRGGSGGSGEKSATSGTKRSNTAWAKRLRSSSAFPSHTSSEALVGATWLPSAQAALAPCETA